MVLGKHAKIPRIFCHNPNLGAKDGRMGWSYMRNACYHPMPPSSAVCPKECWAVSANSRAEGHRSGRSYLDLPKGALNGS